MTTAVTVRAENEHAALNVVNRDDFELPTPDAWLGLTDWVYTVVDADGAVALEAS
jgi:hypothetical protein